MRFIEGRQSSKVLLIASFAAVLASMASACGSPGAEASGTERAASTDAREPGASVSARMPVRVPVPVPLRVPAQVPVRPGIDVLLDDSIHLVAGKSIGLITNHTGLDRAGVPSVDRLAEHPGVSLVALFSPEHGIRGQAEAGDRVQSSTDQPTGLPIYSLYGSTLKPTPEMLAGIQVLLFDIQDIGARYYTYVSTMALAMEAAGEARIPMIVLDRPNPLGGTAVQGNVLDPAFASFVGKYPVPMRHGMTPGELAVLFQAEFGIEVDLAVIPLDGWTRGASFESTGLPWVAPSPNMPSVISALHYPGTCLFEGTNLSVARGTDRPFQQIGAPWLDGNLLAERLNARNIPDVHFEPVRFTPRAPGDGKFSGEEVGGVRLIAMGDSYDPTEAAVALLVEARALSGDRWAWRPAHFDRLAGTDRLRMGLDDGDSVDELTRGWAEALDGFRALRRPYLLYP